MSFCHIPNKRVPKRQALTVWLSPSEGPIREAHFAAFCCCKYKREYLHSRAIPGILTHLTTPPIISVVRVMGSPSTSIPALMSKTCNVDAIKIASVLLLKCLPGHALQKTRFRVSISDSVRHTASTNRLPNPNATVAGSRIEGSMSPSTPINCSGRNSSGWG